MKSIFRSLMTLALFVIAVNPSSKADAPNVISYQGRLTTAGGTPINAPTSLRFRLYTAAIGGVTLYDSGPQVITVTDGLFSVELGKAPLPNLFVSPIFADSSVYLGITVGADPEITPRTRITTSGYASHVQSVDGAEGGTIKSYLGVKAPGANEAVEILGSVSQLRTMGSDGLEQIRLWGPSWGELLLFDASPSNFLTMYLGSGSGGQMTLYDPSGNPTHTFYGSSAGDFSTNLPTDAINSTEMLNEPGITHEEGVSYFLIPSNSAVMTDVMVTTVTIPEAGYIVVTASGIGYRDNSAGGGNLYLLQIDETPGGGLNLPYFTAWGQDVVGGAPQYTPVSVTRVYFKPAGIHTFRAEMAGDLFNAAGGTGGIGWAKMTATYMPTSYGPVTLVNANSPDGAVSDRSEINVGASVSAAGANSGSAIVKTDLRDLEIQAAKAKAEALKLELQLHQAKIDAAREQSGQTLTGASIEKK